MSEDLYGPYDLHAVNPWEAAARARKAAILASAFVMLLREIDCSIDEFVQAQPDVSDILWRKVADITGVTPPSTDTKILVVNVLRQVEQLSDALDYDQDVQSWKRARRGKKVR